MPASLLLHDPVHLRALDAVLGHDLFEVGAVELPAHGLIALGLAGRRNVEPTLAQPQATVTRAQPFDDCLGYLEGLPLMDVERTTHDLDHVVLKLQDRVICLCRGNLWAGGHRRLLHSSDAKALFELRVATKDGTGTAAGTGKEANAGTAGAAGAGAGAENRSTGGCTVCSRRSHCASVHLWIPWAMAACRA